ncbi:monoamine oxidase [Rhizobium sp. SJZ105]|uniref:flavin monoamine oxidase family protein n=1 Tax=Rhizobium sp. SJZ105 TaxID=2572678 RepID=UPI0011A3F27E|nr:NAD(P)/FAD-dependent oxidoreductase [Rhizobium sp. SJZ105]TWC77231.1 monoamine oxidase [Rhizobium sp. SJZ105]
MMKPNTPTTRPEPTKSGGTFAPAISTLASTIAADGQESDIDVIVIGGGFAGCTAARELGNAGLNTVILEARTIVGGRTHTGEYNGHPAEFGGTWVHWCQPNVWAEMNRYGLGVKESAGAVPDTVAWMVDGKVRTETSDIYLEIFVGAMQKFCNVDGMGGATIFPQAHSPFDTDTWKQYDGMTCVDRIDSLDATAEEKALLNSWVATCCNNDPSLAGFVDMLKWYSLGDFNVGLLWDRCGHYKIREGTAGLIDRLIADGKPDVKVSSPVKKIIQSADCVEVTVEGGATYRARRVICTVPLNTLHNVEFHPPLMSAKITASKERHTGAGLKFYFTIDKNVGKFLASAPYPFPISMFWMEYTEDDKTIMVALASPTEIDLLDPAVLTPYIQKFIPGASVIDVDGFQWAEDEYIQGTWCFYKKGQFTNALAALQASEGFVHFASADSANGWRGFIDGAIERGNHVARTVISELKKA